jgi:ribosome maturation protein SDO1
MSENTVAKIRVGGKHFEVLIEDVDLALKFKKTGEGSVNEFLAIEEIFTDANKGERASEKDLEEAFGSSESNNVAEQIVKRGEINVPLEYKRQELGERGKQIVNFLVKNAVDPRTDRPYTNDRIETALKESGVNISNKPVESQLKEIMEKLSKILPIKIESKKVLVTVPAQYTGVAYGILQNYKESEEWEGNGDLKARVIVPNGLLMEFYDKLNNATHGSAMSEEIKENE